MLGVPESSAEILRLMRSPGGLREEGSTNWNSEQSGGDKKVTNLILRQVFQYPRSNGNHRTIPAKPPYQLPPIVLQAVSCPLDKPLPLDFRVRLALVLEYNEPGSESYQSSFTIARNFMCLPELNLFPFQRMEQRHCNPSRDFLVLSHLENGEGRHCPRPHLALTRNL